MTDTESKASPATADRFIPCSSNSRKTPVSGELHGEYTHTVVVVFNSCMFETTS